MVNGDLWKVFGKRQGRPVTLQFKFFPTDRALSILRGKTGENFPSGTAQIFNNKVRAFVCYCIHLEYQ